MAMNLADNDELRSPTPSDTDSKKRHASSSGFDSAGNPKPVKRRAAKACAACRARKVRCDVMQRYHVTADGDVTCSNCTMDGIKCVIEESKRRKKHLHGATATAPHASPKPLQAWGNGIVNPSDIEDPEERRWSNDSSNLDAIDDFPSSHVPHAIYQNMGRHLEKGQFMRQQGLMAAHQFEADPTYTLLNSASVSGDLRRTRLATPPMVHKHQLPPYFKPLPQRMTAIDIDFLFAKGALSLPSDTVRNALLEAYCNWVHPYMPSIDLHQILRIINDEGASGDMSLLLFHCIMFAGTAFVDMEVLEAAGFKNRKAARKAFFQRARVLYDFDYESDRVSLVQSLLLMTYWYETPEDQKDTWHWMGVAISLALTIGLHRDPAGARMNNETKISWRRIWWSCFMRDRLVALGMRRPTRIKDEDCDVPMLEEADFEIRALSPDINIISPDCVLRNVQAQRDLALMCIAKAKHCQSIGHVLSVQYSTIINYQGTKKEQERLSNIGVLIIPKKTCQAKLLRDCDDELTGWAVDLPDCCRWKPEIQPRRIGEIIHVHRSLLHMVFYTTLSALHRPQVLPCGDTAEPAQLDPDPELTALSRHQVRQASRYITQAAISLANAGLEMYLPTTGVTVLLPAIIIHLLDIREADESRRAVAMDGFHQCMAVLHKLRDTYSSADFATGFLSIATKKVHLDVVPSSAPMGTSHAENREYEATQERLREMRANRFTRRTPPLSDEEYQPGPSHTTAHTPPSSDTSPIATTFVVPPSATPNPHPGLPNTRDTPFEDVFDHDDGLDHDFDFDDFLHPDNDLFAGAAMDSVVMHGESSGFMADMGFLQNDGLGNGFSRMHTPEDERSGEQILRDLERARQERTRGALEDARREVSVAA